MPIKALETTPLKYLKKNPDRGLPINSNCGGLWGDRTVATATAAWRQQDTIMGANTTPSTHELLRKIYTDLLLLHDQGHDTWTGRVKAIFVKSITDENLEHTTSSELDMILRKFHEASHELYNVNS